MFDTYVPYYNDYFYFSYNDKYYRRKWYIKCSKD